MAAEIGLDALFAARPELQDLSGKWALISGASSGIGKAVACMLAALKCNVALLARRKDCLNEIKAEIEARCSDIEVKVVAGDVTSDETFVALREKGLLDCIDILVNNAALAFGMDHVQDFLAPEAKCTLDINCYGAFRLVREVLPGMVDRGGGHVISTGSNAGMEAYEGGSVYVASKHALHAFMKALRYETYNKNIRCTVVAPGAVGEGTEFAVKRFRGDTGKAEALYHNFQELSSMDVASQIIWAIRQPPHVNIDMLHVMPTCQASQKRIHRAP
mmetsp:Transcript_10514/g.23477  ORF Transcript_10514/g.23477 Transcript_10514/m.23477 type:complete len:275 (+) Transcript_10514:49-873(+)